MENQIEKKGKKINYIYGVWSHKEKKEAKRDLKEREKWRGSTKGGGGGGASAKEQVMFHSVVETRCKK